MAKTAEYLAGGITSSGGLATGWTNALGNSSRDLAQGTSAKRPNYLSSGWLGGPCVEWPASPGGDLFLEAVGGVGTDYWSVSGATIIAVIEAGTPTTDNVNPALNHQIVFGNGFLAAMRATSNVFQGAAYDGAFNIATRSLQAVKLMLTVRLKSGNIECSINDGAWGTNTSGNITAGPNVPRVGSNNAAGTNFIGKIRRIALYDHGVSDAERDAYYADVLANDLTAPSPAGVTPDGLSLGLTLGL